MNIERFRGDTKPFSLFLSDAGSPLNLTGCVIKLTVNKQSNPVDATQQVFQLNGTVATPTNGVVEFSMDDTQANNVGIFYFDIEVTDAQAKKFTVTKGVFQMLQDITK
jgi:hypothetical protein